MREQIQFPNSMVDRITPVTTDDDRAQLRQRFGVDDRWPVVCEPFAQWVLEDSFAGGRPPPVEEAGVQVVDDVEPYELMKLRLLNASHQAIAYLGYLAGYRLVHDACQDPLFAGFLLAYMDREATPHSSRSRVSTSTATSTSFSNAFPTRRSATPSRGCAPKARTASRNGYCR